MGESSKSSKSGKKNYGVTVMIIQPDKNVQNFLLDKVKGNIKYPGEQGNNQLNVNRRKA